MDSGLHSHLHSHSDSDLGWTKTVKKDDPLSNVIWNGMEVSPYPTHRHKCLRKIRKTPGFNDIFKHVSEGATWIYVFVDPHDLSYHNYDNILCLDKYISSKRKITANHMSRTGTYDLFELDGLKNLKELDEMNLYEPRFTEGYRGGQRFLFMSRRLATRLYKAFKPHFPDMIKVNELFRFNKFEPGDNPFIGHYDTPYNTSNSISKFTLIIYLTGGSSPNDIINIAGNAEKTMNSKTAIVFSQEHEHEGNPYVGGDKIFIRTELIYKKDTDAEEVSAEAAKSFNIACYMTKYSPFSEDLHGYATMLFNNTCRLRYKHTFPTEPNTIYLFKMDRFITNGNDYWFLSDVPHETAVLYILYDYYKSIPISTVLKDLKEADIPGYLIENTKEETVIARKGKLLGIGANVMSHIAPTHGRCWCGECAPPRRYPCSGRRSISIFGESIVINMKDLVIADGVIEFKHAGTFRKINFASCQGFDCSSEKVNNPQLPPIFYHNEGVVIHYNIDMFNNNYVINHRNKVYDD